MEGDPNEVAMVYRSEMVMELSRPITNYNNDNLSLSLMPLKTSGFGAAPR